MDLIEKLREYAQADDLHKDERDTLIAAAAALEAAREALDREAALKGGVEHQRDTLWAELEAAREDACVALVADIRFACGDNGKRMQPELVEFIRELAADAERLDFVMRNSLGSELRRIGIHTNGGDHRAAIDQARGKGVADEA